MTRPCGPDCAVGGRYSLISPVFGFRWPNTFAYCPLYQMVPSGAANGSWGREPLVGTSHSLNVTFAAPGTITACGISCSGKFLPRYSLTTAACSGESCAPTFTMRSTSKVQSLAVWPGRMRFREWHSAQAPSTRGLPGPSGILGSGVPRCACANTATSKVRNNFLGIVLLFRALYCSRTDGRKESLLA